MQLHWYVYLVRCCDHSLYAGVTTDLNARVGEHNDGKGTKYTRIKGPVRLVYYERQASKTAAIRRAAAIKKLPKQLKEFLALGRRGAQLNQWQGLGIAPQAAGRAA